MHATITQIKDLGSHSFGFWLKPMGPFPRFVAGQHVALVLLNPQLVGPDKAHTYTLASAPSELPEILIASKNSPSRFKGELRKLKEGDEISITPPVGDFVLHPGKRPVVMIAGGIGVTPFRSMLRETFHKEETRQIELLYSNRTPDIAFKDEFDEWAKRRPNFKVTYTVTEPVPRWEGDRRTVDEQFLREFCPAPGDNDYYVCGPPKMVDDCVEHLKKLGVPESQIFFERFTGYAGEHPHAQQ